MYSTGNYIQYVVITYNGKNFEKEYIYYIYLYLYLYISPVLLAMYWKVTQHCQSTAFSFKKETIQIAGAYINGGGPEHTKVQTI